jgi:hypothetical protein
LWLLFVVPFPFSCWKIGKNQNQNNNIFWTITQPKTYTVYMQDEDVMEGNNLIASVKSQWDVQKLSYYAIALPWFQTAYPALTGQRGRVGVGSIQNESLLGGPTTISTEFTHGVGYVLVGPRTWLLLSQKFGYDKELACRCVYNQNNHHHHHHHNKHQDPPSPSPPPASTTTPTTTARLSFIINSAERVDFVTGRFPYEKYVQSEAVVSDEETTELEEDDDDDDDDDQEDEHQTEHGEADDAVDDLVRYIYIFIY